MSEIKATKNFYDYGTWLEVLRMRYSYVDMFQVYVLACVHMCGYPTRNVVHVTCMWVCAYVSGYVWVPRYMCL